MIEIKPMQAGQWQLHKSVRCAALANAPNAFSSTLDDVLKRSDAEWQQLTRQYASHPNSHTYFAFENYIACGISACVINGENVELFSVWVDPKHRRKGVGRALVEYGRKWSLSKGAIRIKVGIYQDNQNAVVFYRSMGFVDSGQVDPVLSSRNRAVFLFSMQLR